MSCLPMIMLTVVVIAVVLPSSCETLLETPEIITSSEEEVLDELELDNGDDVFQLWANIDAAFRFLEAETIDEDLKQKLLAKVRRQIAPFRTKKMPFVRHNFVRFGKRDL